jgi:hypothetical protein
MTSVNVTTTQNTVTVSEDGSTVTIQTGDVSQYTFDALVARVAQLESVDYLVLQDGN